jgi:hypothetical protein
MGAMDSATRNAGEMIKKQTLIYNRTRQAMITKVRFFGRRAARISPSPGSYS